MRKMYAYLIILSTILLSSKIYAANIYVDKTLSSDCLSGNYSTANRNCNGNDGNAYRTVQAAINAMNVGDTCYMRGGTYQEGHISIPYTKRGTSWNQGNYYTLCSYPDEWAILDGQRNCEYEYPSYGSVLGYASNSSSNMYEIKYWKFERFEIKNGGSNSGTGGHAAGFAGSGGPMIFRYLYIHNNTAPSGGDNPGGIRMYHMHDTTIEYCWFQNNAQGYSSSDKNSSEIITIVPYNAASIADSGYSDSSNNVASSKNILRYNLIEGYNVGYKYKGTQLFSSRRPGQWQDGYSTYGDKIHHNIFIGLGHGAVHARQDFIQVYNNIVVGGSWGIMTQYEEWEALYKACIYNNTVMNIASAYGIDANGGISRLHDQTYDYEDTSYRGWDFNNLLDNCAGGRKGSRALTVGYSDNFNLSNYHASNNYFYRPTSSDVIVLVSSGGQSDDCYTVGEFESQSETSSPRIAYSNSYDSGNPLYKGSTGANQYKTRASHVIESSKTIANGGIGGAHPYLTGVTIPSYVGATDPNNDDWVDTVLNLVNLPIIDVDDEAPAPPTGLRIED